MSIREALWVSKERKIRKDGIPYKSTTISYKDNITTILYCHDCGTTYDFSFNDKGQIVEYWENDISQYSRPLCKNVIYENEKTIEEDNDGTTRKN